MEVNDVLVALENLKKELENVRSAKESVEKAVAAANEVSHGFGECSESFKVAGESMCALAERVAAVQDQFKSDVLLPLEAKVKELIRAGDGLTESSGRIVQSFSEKCDGIVSGFRNTVNDMAKDIDGNIIEFHKELESFGGKMSRMTERLEGEIADVSKKISGYESFVRGELLEKIVAGQENSVQKAVVAIAVVKEELNKSNEAIQADMGEMKRLSEASREEICAKIGELKDDQIFRMGSLKRMILAMLVMIMIIGVVTLAGVGFVVYAQLIAK